jgi:hypothetical protein
MDIKNHDRNKFYEHEVYFSEQIIVWNISNYCKSNEVIIKKVIKIDILERKLYTKKFDG